jgi:hypothetical protein
MTERCSSLVHVASGAAIFTLLLRRRDAFLHRTAICRPLFKPSVSLLSTGRQSSCVSNFYHTFKVFIWLSLVPLLRRVTSQKSEGLICTAAEARSHTFELISKLWQRNVSRFNLDRDLSGFEWSAVRLVVTEIYYLRPTFPPLKVAVLLRRIGVLAW